MPSKRKKKIVIGHKIDGTPVYKNFGAKTKREMDEKVRDFQRKQILGIKDAPDITFESWADNWLETYKEGKVGDSTYRGYELCVKHLNEFMGNALLRNVKAADMQRFFNKKANLSQSMIRKLKITVNAIFDTAVANDLITKNPCILIQYPKGKIPSEKTVYTKEEYLKVLDYSKSHPDGLGVFLILKTGFRKGEMLGVIPRRDINIKEGFIFMQRTITDSAGYAQIKEGGKSKSAVRKIPIDEEFIFELSRRLIINEDDLLFKTRYGRILGPRTWTNNAYQRFCKDLAIDYPEIPILTPHELRHTFGTLLFKEGTDVFTLQRIMGHADIGTTTKFYVHDSFDDIKRNIRQII